MHLPSSVHLHGCKPVAIEQQVEVEVEMEIQKRINKLTRVLYHLWVIQLVLVVIVENGEGPFLVELPGTKEPNDEQVILANQRQVRIGGLELRLEI